MVVTEAMGPCRGGLAHCISALMLRVVVYDALCEGGLYQVQYRPTRARDVFNVDCRTKAVYEGPRTVSALCGSAWNACRCLQGHMSGA